MPLIPLRLTAILLCLWLPQGVAAPDRLRVSDGAFARSDGSRFQWRGITAFRLAELIASGREREAGDYLAWAGRQQLTVVRVLAMARHLFSLPPERGRAAMAKLLPLAASHGVAVEIVALADTASYQFDRQAHVRELGQLCARAGLCTLEIANEPSHGTQDPKLHDSSYLVSLRRLIPAEVPVAMGDGRAGANPGPGDYVTEHFPRDPDWGHVAALAEGAALRVKFRAPVVNDEPIGAAERAIPGSRDASPERFRAAALLSILAGLGATFHYDGGLHARIPEERQAECFAAWRSAWELLPGKPMAEFRELKPSDPLAFKGSVQHAWIARDGSDAWVLAVGVAPDVSASAARGRVVRRTNKWQSSGLWLMTPEPKAPPRPQGSTRRNPFEFLDP